MRRLNNHPSRAGARYVLYWALVNRRVDSNHALQWASALANDLDLPLLYYEELPRSPMANDRMHTFVLEGVSETARRLKKLGIGYVFYVQKCRSDPYSMAPQLAAKAAALVLDDYPLNLDYPQLDLPCYAVDSSCVVPMSRFAKREYAAYSLRPKLTKLLPRYLEPVDPVRVRRRFTDSLPAAVAVLAADCEIDHSVKPSVSFRGGRREAERALTEFLGNRLRRYAREKNEPAARATSDLSPYLHFGQISSLEVALAVQAHAAEHKLIADEFLEELIVRRELAFNFVRHTSNFRSLSALPAWARETLAKHDRDPRPASYSRDEFVNARTGDALWNAAQTEMLLRGKIHGYYRMYWGKKIIEWSPSHAEALETMLAIHDRYALDGRDPNTYANLLWCFGLHDRPWQERPVFGMIRYMSLEGMRRKTDVDAYIREIEGLK